MSPFRFFTTHKPLFSFCFNSSFPYSNPKPTISHFHSHTQTKPTTNFNKSSTKQTFITPKAYMKDTITTISNILRYSSWDSAQQHLQTLTIKWDSYTVNQVLKTHPPMEKSWLFFSWASGLRNFKHDQFTYTTMMDIFGEARRISSMKFVFQQMQDKGVKADVVTYTSMLHWLSNDGDVDGAVKLWEEMKEKGVGPTVVSYTAYMKVLFDNGRVKEATEVYKEMIRAGWAPSCVTYTVLMEHLAGCGKFNEVLDIFIKMQEAGVQPDKAACNILVENCCKAGETRVMMKILEYMKENSLVLRQPIYTKALETLKTAGESDALLKESNRHLSVHYKKPEPLVKDTVSDTISIDQRLVLYLLTRKHFVGVDFLLKDMMEKNVFLTPEIVSSVIDAYTAHERSHGAVVAYEYGKKIGIKYEKYLYLSLVGLFMRTNSFPMIVDIVEEMIKSGFFLGVNQSALLIYKLGCANKPVSAAKVFDLLPDNEKNTTTYTALMAAYFASRRTCKGLEIFKEMKDVGIPVVVGTYNVLLAGLEKSGRVVEFEYYRKEKKQMQNISFSENEECAEEMSCNMLFGRDYAS
ncbi:putative tetratricopeptide-like helical domain superfamily [Helianthus debilis subsp. tardiflorus]